MTQARDTLLKYASTPTPGYEELRRDAVDLIPTPPDLAVSLERAVTDAISPVNYTTIAQAICRSQNGETCMCQRRFWKKCHASDLYGDMALAVMTLLKRAGAMPKIG